MRRSVMKRWSFKTVVRGILLLTAQRIVSALPTPGAGWREGNSTPLLRYPRSSQRAAMAATCSLAAVASSAPATAHCDLMGWRVQRWGKCCGSVGTVGGRRSAWPVFNSSFSNRKKRWRRVPVCAVNQDAEKSFQKTVEVDRLIDMLRDSNAKELEKLIVENILAFDESFWIRLAARSDTCKSDDDKKDYEELAASVMSIVDRLVHKTNEKIESATDVLKAILKPVVDEDAEISWPPRKPDSLILMERELEQREQEGQLDEGFLSEVNAQLRQAKEDGDRPGLEAMLQKVLQLYASKTLSNRSYAKKGNEVLRAESFLESIIKAPEGSWNKLLIEGLTVGTGDISPEDFYAVVNKRIERTLIRTEGGSYQQRILVEYLKGIESRAEEIIQAIQGK